MTAGQPGLSQEVASVLVGSLKDAAASIYLLMALTHSTKVVWEVDELCHGTKYKRDAVMAGRRELMIKGLAAQIGARYGLRLTDKAVRQLQLPLRELAQPGMAHTAGQPQQANPEPEPKVREVGITDLQVDLIDLPPYDVVVGQQIRSDPDHHHQQQQQPARSEKSTSQVGTDGERWRAIIAACIEAGIDYPKRNEVAANPAVTADLVQRAVRQRLLENRLNGWWDHPVGKAITTLLGLQEEREVMTADQMDEWERREAVREGQGEAPAEMGDPDLLGPIPMSETPRDASLDVPITPGGSMKPGHVWQAVLGELQLQMGRPTFDTWVKPAQVIRYAEDRFIIGVPHEYIKDWLETKLLSSIQRSLVGVMGRPVSIEFIVRKP